MKFSRISLVLSLFLVLFTATVITALFTELTREPINQVAIRKQEKLIRSLISEPYDNDLVSDKIMVTALGDLGTGDPVPIYRARKNGHPVGFVILPVAPNGYNGPIRLAVGLDAGGRILVVRVIEDRETPGFGDKIHRQKSDWINQFTGKSLTELTAGGAVDQISGASISSNAVIKAVTRVLEYYQREKEQLWKKMEK